MKIDLHRGSWVSDNFIKEMMSYEYVLYKPLTMWPELKIKLNGKTFKQLLTESQRLRNTIENDLGIPTDLSDEHFLMMHSAGFVNTEDIKKFKKIAMTSIVSCDYREIDRISQKVTAHSRALAQSNLSKATKSTNSAQKKDSVCRELPGEFIKV